VPNLLSALRIALMPAVLLTAVGGSKPWFVGLLVAALLTDAFDGFLARRLHAESELGRKLDSFADYLVMITGIAGIALLWPDIMRRELPWVATTDLCGWGGRRATTRGRRRFWRWRAVRR
jgi:phosphatidylglycerophosphate synthase